MWTDDLKTQDARQVWARKHIPGMVERWEKFWSENFEEYVAHMKKLKGQQNEKNSEKKDAGSDKQQRGPATRSGQA